MLIIIVCVLVCEGLILSKALKAQKDAEDESTQIAFRNLRSEVITLRNEALEKDKILLYLVDRLKSSEARLASLSEVEQKMEKFENKNEIDAKCIADLEYSLSIQVGLHRSKVQGLEKTFDEITENFNVEQAKREISDTERLRVQKNVEGLPQAKEECYNVAMECCNKLKIVSLKLTHSLWNRTLSVVILTGLSDGSVAKSKLLMKFFVIEEIFAPSPVPEELSHSSKKLDASMQRL
jgi:hypothetical protein